MQRYMFLALASALLAVAVIPASARGQQDQPPPPPVDPNKTYDLAAKYSVGDLLKYKAQMNFNVQVTTPGGNNAFPGGDIAGGFTMRMKTVGLLPDGTGVIALTVEGSEMSMMGNTLPMPQMPTTMIEADRRGRTKPRGLATAPGAGQAFAQMFDMNRMSSSMGAVLPDHPVKVGDTWQTEMPMPIGGTLKVVNTLMGVETVGGLETLKVKQVMTMPFDIKIGPDQKPTRDASKAVMVMTGSGTVDGVLNILESNARLVRMVADIKSDMAMELNGDAAQQSPFGSTMS